MIPTQSLNIYSSFLQISHSPNQLPYWLWFQWYFHHPFISSIVQFSRSVVSDSATPWTAALQASLSITNSWILLKLISIELAMPSNPLSSPSSPAFNLSNYQGLFQWASPLHQVAKVLELQCQSFQWRFRTDFIEDWVVRSPCSSRAS